MIYEHYIAKNKVNYFSAIEFAVLIFLLNYFSVILSNHNPDIFARLSSNSYYVVKYNLMSLLISIVVLAGRMLLSGKLSDKRFQKLSNDMLLAEAVLCGAAIFTTIYGIKVLNPLYTDWLMAGGDLSQHYLGWCFFRSSDWQFPIGLFDSLSYPHSASIIYTDSIPLFAIFFKLFSFALPESFQYFGLWGIMCFSLQCLIGTIICRKYTDNRILALMGGILLTVAPVMIQRMFGHTALAGHWIILLSWLPIVYIDKFQSRKSIMAFWFGIGVLCSFVHLYFIPLCGISLCAFILKKWIRERKVHAVLDIVPYICGGISAIWLLGGFTAEVSSYEASGFGTYGANLNTYFNTQGNAILLGNSGYYGSGQYEGFGYLGAGILVLSILSVTVFMQEFMENRTERKRCLISAIPYMAVFLASTVLAMIPNIALNGNLLFKISLPGIITKFMGVFRANGRFIWGGCTQLL